MLLLSLFFGFLIFFQQHLVFFPPTRQPTQKPHYLETAAFVTSDGFRLHGFFLPGEAEDAPTILYFHGNAETAADNIPLAEWSMTNGFGLLLYDYRGYGSSEGHIPKNENEFFLDGEAAWTYLTDTKQIAPTNIVLWGRSLGGAAAVHLASIHRPRAVVLQSTFASGIDLGKQMMPWLPIASITRFPFRNDEKITQSASPLLVLHAPDDSVIPFQQGRLLFEHAPLPKNMMLFSGGHNPSFQRFINQTGSEIQSLIKTPR